ncbi:hypothetical protein LguiB_013087 [Lonicera macranthoides]
MMHFGCLLNNNDNSTAVPDYDSQFDHNELNTLVICTANFTAAHLELQQFIQLCAQVLVQAVGYFCFVGSSLAFCPALFSLPVLAFLLLFCEFSWWTLVLRTRSVSWTSVMSGLAVNGSADDALPQALLSNARRRNAASAEIATNKLLEF